MSDYDLPLIETAPMSDVFAEDIDHIEVFGDNARFVLWRWRVGEDRLWQRVALDIAIVRPLRSVHRFLSGNSDLRVMRAPLPRRATVIEVH